MLSVKAAELDEAIRTQDKLILAARVQGVDERFIWRAVQARNDLVKDWGVAWNTKGVA